MRDVNWKKFLVIGGLAAAGAAGHDYVATDTVNLANVIVVLLGALLGYLTDSKK